MKNHKILYATTAIAFWLVGGTSTKAFGLPNPFAAIKQKVAGTPTIKTQLSPEELAAERAMMLENANDAAMASGNKTIESRRESAAKASADVNKLQSELVKAIEKMENLKRFAKDGVLDVKNEDTVRNYSGVISALRAAGWSEDNIPERLKADYTVVVKLASTAAGSDNKETIYELESVQRLLTAARQKISTAALKDNLITFDINGKKHRMLIPNDLSADGLMRHRQLMIGAGYTKADEGFDVNSKGINYVHFGVLNGEAMKKIVDAGLVNDKFVKLWKELLSQASIKSSEIPSVAFGVETSDGRIVASSPTGQSVMMIYHNGFYRKAFFTGKVTMLATPKVTQGTDQPGRKIFHSIANAKTVVNFLTRRMMGENNGSYEPTALAKTMLPAVRSESEAKSAPKMLPSEGKIVRQNPMFG